MKIYINEQADALRYDGQLKKALEEIGIEVVSDLEGDYDDGLSVVASDNVDISANLLSRNKTIPAKHYLCDKWYMYNFLKKSSLPFIETCIPQSMQDIQDFFDLYGGFIIKPRVGGGGNGPWGLHYNRYLSMEHFKSDVDKLPQFWDYQTTTIYNSEKLTKQCIIQPYLIGDDDGYTEQIRIKGDINHNGDFVYHTTQRTKKTVKNSDTPTYDPNAWQQAYIHTPGMQEAYERQPNDMDYQDPAVENIVRSIIEATGIRSTYFTFECLVIDDVFYVNDITTIPPSVRYKFAEIDGINYIAHGLKWQFGMSDELPKKFARYYQMSTFLIPGGVTREKIASIENNNVKRLNKTFVGASEVWILIRGNTIEEFTTEKQRLFDYLNSLETA